MQFSSKLLHFSCCIIWPIVGSQVEGSAGAGAVRVSIKGNHKIISIEIEDDAFKGNKTILQDYLIAACNDAMNKLEKETKEKMGSVMNLPGGMKLPF